jgi:hypothetical protein
MPAHPFFLLMKNRPIHENLDTSFVNLSALVRYLRRRQFAGNVRVEMSGYEADIVLTAAGEMSVREHDRIAGRISEGDEAFERLLIRAGEPGGVINVCQAVESSAAAIDEPTLIVEKTVKEIPFAVETKQAVGGGGSGIAAKPPHRNGNSVIAEAKPNAEIEVPPIEDVAPKPSKPLPEISLDFGAQSDDKPEQPNFAALEDWQMVLNLTAELLNTIDKSLAEANLEFAAAFEKARAEVSGDYPFLNSASGVFEYKNGKIIVRRQINERLLTAGINETLRRILEKLGRNPKFSNVYLITTHRILALIEKRRPLYDKFAVTPQLAKIIGI